MFIDIDCHQQKKFGQSAYGDYFTSKDILTADASSLFSLTGSAAASKPIS